MANVASNNMGGRNTRMNMSSLKWIFSASDTLMSSPAIMPTMIVAADSGSQRNCMCRTAPRVAKQAPRITPIPIIDRSDKTESSSSSQRSLYVRSEERRVGKERVSTSRSRGSLYNEKKHNKQTK